MAGANLALFSNNVKHVVVSAGSGMTAHYMGAMQEGDIGRLERGGLGRMDMVTLPAMILRMGSTIDRSSTVPVATAGSKGVYRK